MVAGWWEEAWTPPAPVPAGLESSIATAKGTLVKDVVSLGQTQLFWDQRSAWQEGTLTHSCFLFWTMAQRGRGRARQPGRSHPNSMACLRPPTRAPSLMRREVGACGPAPLPMQPPRVEGAPGWHGTAKPALTELSTLQASNRQSTSSDFPRQSQTYHPEG